MPFLLTFSHVLVPKTRQTSLNCCSISFIIHCVIWFRSGFLSLPLDLRPSYCLSISSYACYPTCSLFSLVLSHSIFVFPFPLHFPSIVHSPSSSYSDRTFTTHTSHRCFNWERGKEKEWSTWGTTLSLWRKNLHTFMEWFDFITSMEVIANKY